MTKNRHKNLKAEESINRVKSIWYLEGKCDEQLKEQELGKVSTNIPARY